MRWLLRKRKWLELAGLFIAWGLGLSALGDPIDSPRLLAGIVLQSVILWTLR